MPQKPRRSQNRSRVPCLLRNRGFHKSGPVCSKVFVLGSTLIVIKTCRARGKLSSLSPY
jgi:hypothetical protein